MMSILIKNGQVINPATATNEVLDVLLADGKVVKMEAAITDKAERIVDAKGCYVMPGFIDLHVHFRDPGLEHKETIETGSKAAAAGGYTTVFAMPNTKPTADNADVINYVHNKAKAIGLTNVSQVGAVTKGQAGAELADIEEMAKAGILTISEDGKSVMNSQLYREAMELAAKLDLTVLAHCEDINLVNGGVVNADAHTKELGLSGISNSVEDVITARDILLSKETGAKLHLCHCSTKGAVAMVKMAKEEGLRVTAEVCPHHFVLTSADITNPEDTNFKMNPPLRTKEDVDALKAGLRDNIMDVIATDHAPHTFEEKNTTMKKAPFGIVGIETAAALTYSELVLGGYLTPMQMAEKMSYNPAKVVGIDKGDIQVGKTADIVIFNPNETYIIDKNEFASKGKNTPFHGKKVTGRVCMTILNGNIVYER